MNDKLEEMTKTLDYSSSTDLHELADITEAMTEGDFHRKLNVKLTGELAMIAKHINSTRKDLAKITPELMEDVKQRLPNASEELSGISKDTEKATHEILEKTEQALEENEQAEAFHARLHELGERETGEYQEELLEIVGHLEEHQQSQGGLLIEILTATSFQDLTGQKIKKIINMIEIVESKILELLNIFGITEEKITQMEETALPEEKINSFSKQSLKQNLVDDLLKELNL